MIFRFCLCMVFALVLFGSGLQAGDVSLLVPKSWVKEEPKSPMRKAQYQVPGKKSGQEASLRMFSFASSMGGSAEMNIVRWVGQFEDAKGEKKKKADEHKTEKRKAGTVHIVLIKGTNLKKKAPMMANSAVSKMPGQAMLGAIVPTKTHNHFFKLIGPEATVVAAQKDFEAMVKAFK